jgi:integrase
MTTAPRAARGTRETIAGFSPVSVPAEATCFAREVVKIAAPENTARAKALLFATSKLAAFGLSVGLEVTPEVLLHASVIDRFVLVGATGLSPATRRTLRTNLRCVAARVLPRVSPGPVPLSREHAKAPYSKGEIDAYLALARAQPTVARAMRAGGLICLGAGAGLMGHDLRGVRGHDVVHRSGGLVVVVGGRRARVVPVLSGYQELLSSSAAFAGDGYVVGGQDPSRHNLTTPLISALSGGLDLERLDTGRLRSSWLAECAEHIGLGAFMEAAGITCSQRLGDIVASLEQVPEPDAVLLLGARS